MGTNPHGESGSNPVISIEDISEEEKGQESAIFRETNHASRSCSECKGQNCVEVTEHLGICVEKCTREGCNFYDTYSR
jgi:tryptophanyl-tRNA synthetase